MSEQLIIELLELLGTQRVFFDDPPKVRLSPHQWPVTINSARIENRMVLVEVDGIIKSYEFLPDQVKQTIGQRLRLMVSGNYKKA